MIFKIVLRVFVFILSIIFCSYLVEFVISIGYKFMLTQYSLPKIDFDITLISFFISALFLTFLSVISNFWKVSGLVKA